MPDILKSISLALMMLLAACQAKCQVCYPDSLGQRVRYEVCIDTDKAHASGIMILARTEPQLVCASLVNEFGISLLDFSLNEKKDKVKLHSVMKAFDRWYIKRVFRSDLKEMLKVMRDCGNEYYDKRHKIRYTFNLINDTQE